jgi:hypothetical protein
LSNAVEDLTGWYGELNLDSKFVKKNMNDIEKASKGDTNAIIRLGAAVASYSVKQATLNTTLSEGKMQNGALNALQEYANKLGEGTTAAKAFEQA